MSLCEQRGFYIGTHIIYSDANGNIHLLHHTIPSNRV
jgi:hypothetical protein